MKKLIIPIMVAAILIAFYEQSKQKPNTYITIAAIVVFMYGMMRLSAKLPGRKEDNDDDNIQ